MWRNHHSQMIIFTQSFSYYTCQSRENPHAVYYYYIVVEYTKRTFLVWMRPLSSFIISGSSRCSIFEFNRAGRSGSILVSCQQFAVALLFWILLVSSGAAAFSHRCRSIAVPPVAALPTKILPLQIFHFFTMY